MLNYKNIRLGIIYFFGLIAWHSLNIYAKAEIMFVAHDGYIADNFPNNTIEAIYQAIENKIHVIELIVHINQDDVPIIISRDNIITNSNISDNYRLNNDSLHGKQFNNILEKYNNNYTRNLYNLNSQSLLLPHIFKLNYVLEKFSHKLFILKLKNTEPYKTARSLLMAITPKDWSRLIVIPDNKQQAQAIRYTIPAAFVATSNAETQLYVKYFLINKDCRVFNPANHYWVTINSRMFQQEMHKKNIDIAKLMLNFVRCMRANFPQVKFILTDHNDYNLAKYLRIELLYVNKIKIKY